jgi:hypothetical protein
VGDEKHQEESDGGEMHLSDCSCADCLVVPGFEIEADAMSSALGRLVLGANGVVNLPLYLLKIQASLSVLWSTDVAVISN